MSVKTKVLNRMLLFSLVNSRRHRNQTEVLIVYKCESAHSEKFPAKLWSSVSVLWRGSPISNDKAFDDCMILEKGAFDPEAVFLDDIVDDNVLPYPNLAVDGLSESADGKMGGLELRPEDMAANDSARPDSVMPQANLDPDQLDVYGWEPSLWKKIKAYFEV